MRLLANWAVCDFGFIDLSFLGRREELSNLAYRKVSFWWEWTPYLECGGICSSSSLSGMSISFDLTGLATSDVHLRLDRFGLFRGWMIPFCESVFRVISYGDFTGELYILSKNSFRGASEKDGSSDG